ncbi:hypothetical protein Kpol_1012p4 [Vanderwaltozyma polyspora DSM 70294]|uniref:PHD-type domain-containing protein n=1 Tax=Vanderwaltozyma polyspora (strain ATCC 22028 / DSM 70294 / BCRC 21397 / CBS 2163 / NBRC 10782 / NRRL Y-8283 / UCD 57-17) TaxID=436907 RepID=A7TS78_VANPO|nr:uncharacterized protein Kpol_1012p4 [Vanderwaltozyma polyspora DSM 70294]EDO14877.1 hypothetical protein Kpol_1012p4 [Vanderwaltozyma polyspora DSM 70294]
MIVELPDWCPPYSSLKVDSVTNEDVYCICKKPDNGELMVGCDGCDDWFHFKCLHISTKYKELVSSFYCPYCQAGITGNKNEEDDVEEVHHKTLWKRKCRLQDCYKPCQDNSKYCSGEHGEEYMRSIVMRVKIQGNNDSNKDYAFVQKLVQSSGTADKFKIFGESDFTKKDIDPKLNVELFDKLIMNDTNLKELQEKEIEINQQQIPDVESKLESLDKYLQWLKALNAKLTEVEGATIVEPKKKGNRKKTKSNHSKRICGFTNDIISIPNTDEFTESYSQDSTTHQGICTKIKCAKHHDWASMLIARHNQDLRTLETYSERLNLLIKMRKEQLNIQFYEKLIK